MANHLGSLIRSLTRWWWIWPSIRRVYKWSYENKERWILWTLCWNLFYRNQYLNSWFGGGWLNIEVAWDWLFSRKISIWTWKSWLILRLLWMFQARFVLVATEFKGLSSTFRHYGRPIFILLNAWKYAIIWTKGWQSLH